MELVRREIRLLGLHKRAGGLNALDRITIHRYIEASVVLLALVEVNSGEDEMSHDSDNEEWDLIVALIMMEVYEMRRERRIERPPISTVRRTISSLCSGECWTKHRLRQEDIADVMKALGFTGGPFSFENSRFEAEELFLLWTRRMA